VGVDLAAIDPDFAELVATWTDAAAGVTRAKADHRSGGDRQAVMARMAQAVAGGERDTDVLADELAASFADDHRRAARVHAAVAVADAASAAVTDACPALYARLIERADDLERLALERLAPYTDHGDPGAPTAIDEVRQKMRTEWAPVCALAHWAHWAPKNRSAPVWAGVGGQTYTLPGRVAARILALEGAEPRIVGRQPPPLQGVAPERWLAGELARQRTEAEAAGYNLPGPGPAKAPPSTVPVDRQNRRLGFKP